MPGIQFLNGAAAMSSTAKCTRGHRRPRAVMTTGLVVAIFYLFTSVEPARGEVSILAQSTEQATGRLAKKFEEIRTRVLGVDTLSAEYERVGFDYLTLDISNVLSTSYSSERIGRVFDLLDSINASISADEDIEDCCDGPSSSETCCHGCPAEEDPFLSAIAQSFSSTTAFSNMGLELDFGREDGTLLRFPTSQPPADCTAEDSRLQPWYVDMVHNRSLEVVLLLDVNDEPDNAGLTQTLRNSATSVLESLTLQDKVQVVVFGVTVQNSRELLSSNNVVPVCSSHVKKLKEFIATTMPPTDSSKAGSYSDGFTTAFSMLNNQSNADKLIIFFTSASNLYVNSGENFDGVLTNVSILNAGLMNKVVISAYVVDQDGDIFGNVDQRIKTLVEQPIPGTLTELDDSDSVNPVNNYYSVFETTPVADIKVGRDTNKNGDAALSVTQSLMNGTEFVGVLHALLPWEPLFPSVDSSLKSGRGQSHFFVMNDVGHVLYHPLLPGNFQSVVSIASIEAPEVLTALLNLRSNESLFEVSTTKPALTPVSVRETHSFIAHSVNMTYHCRRMLATASVTLYACVALTEAEERTVQLKTVDTESVYGSDAERFPLYHTTELDKKDQCFHFCSISTKTDQISVQLSSPSQPPDDVQLQEITDYIRGRTSVTPSWAVGGVASELAVVSVVRDTWLNDDSSVDNYVVRRHLATPSGLYLTLPFAHLSPNFAPHRTEWFTLSSAHPHTLTLTPPRLDALREGGHVVSAGAALSADNGETVAVVAADLTLPSLRVLLEDALPLCKQDNYNCFLLDDQGYFLYHDKLLTSSLNQPIFLVSFADNKQAFRAILANLLTADVAYKQRCIDYLDQDVRQRLFFSFDISSNASDDKDTNNLKYAIQRIPGTNAFLGILQKIASTRSTFCFCSLRCQTCDRDERNGCECPCLCPEDCTTPHSFPPCPPSSLESSQLARGSTAGSGTDIPPFCSNQKCACKTESTECEASSDCHWCSAQRQCRHVSECCQRNADTSSCCTESPFTKLPECMASDVCMAGVDPPKSDCPTMSVNTGDSDDATASIVGGVLGAVLVLILISVLVAIILWHKFCRIEEEQKEENAFDFSQTKLNAKNAAFSSSDSKADSKAASKAAEAGVDDVSNDHQQPTENEGDETTL